MPEKARISRGLCYGRTCDVHLYFRMPENALQNREPFHPLTTSSNSKTLLFSLMLKMLKGGFESHVLFVWFGCIQMSEASGDLWYLALSQLNIDIDEFLVKKYQYSTIVEVFRIIHVLTCC